MSEQKRGVLRALVYKPHPTDDAIVLEIEGESDHMELWENVLPGGDWNEVNILLDQSPPEPPQEAGFWELSWPWHECTDAERKEMGEEYACLYEGDAQWKAMELRPASAPSGGEAR